MDGFLYDPHTHTSQTSACADLDAARAAELYASKGFAGYVVTDHIHPEYVSRIDRRHCWDDVIDHFLSGYRIASKRGTELGLDVILGMELRFQENENDYLIYGIDEKWLREHPYLCEYTAQSFFEKFHEEVLIIQAHPFRNGNQIVFENAFHGVELVNAHPRHNNYNQRAKELCRQHHEYLRLAGSDTHQQEDAARAGIILPERVSNSEAYRRMIQSGRFRLWSPDFAQLIREEERFYGDNP